VKEKGNTLKLIYSKKGQSTKHSSVSSAEQSKVDIMGMLATSDNFLMDSK
jgi:hypothetical protein